MTPAHDEADGRLQVLGETFPIPGLPVTLFVNADRTIAGEKTGPFSSVDDLRDLIEQELGVRR